MSDDGFTDVEELAKQLVQVSGGDGARLVNPELLMEAAAALLLGRFTWDDVNVFRELLSAATSLADEYGVEFDDPDTYPIHHWYDWERLAKAVAQVPDLVDRIQALLPQRKKV